MKSILLTIFFFAAIASAKCETNATETKSDVKTEKAAQPAKETPAKDMKDATAKSIFVGTSEMYLNLVREGIKRA